MSDIHERIKNRRIYIGMSQDVLAEKVGYSSRSTIAKIEKGVNDIPQSKIVAFAKALNTTPAHLMGYDTPEDSPQEKGFNVFSLPGIMPLPKTKKLPLLGSIACGTPLFAEENIESYINVMDKVRGDFCLTCKGDSMINARINDGDIVVIRSQTTVDNGQIAAVLIDTETTLKRVYYYPEEEKLLLNPENPRHAPLMYVGAQLEGVRILGLAVAFQSLVY